MYLKRLDIQGFKSFPDKISLEFNPGITSVVGPNGSGKSNIADAIRWVMGEQSVKTLRGSKMEDVIFSGTEHRKPLGFAEVSITIDNSDGELPVEYSEVTITRRVFRSGESEYLINKAPCRLKDINELFFDTGLGKDGYSVIGQGRIDEILSTRSEDRRNIFEEASGIMKYKVRKQEAERKLEATEQNLVRINDIIAELESQLEPLALQAETARKYLSLRESLKELEVNVFLDSIDKSKEKLKNIEEQYSSIKDNIDEENRRIQLITAANRQKNEYLKALEEKMNNARQEFYDLEGSLERCNSEIRLNEEKMSNLDANISRLEKEIADIEAKSTELFIEERTKQDKLEYLNGRYLEYSAKLEEYEKQLEAVISTLNEEERHIEKLKSDVMYKLDLLTDKKMQIHDVKTHMESIQKRQKSIDSELGQIKLEIDREEMKKEDLEESLRRIREKINISEAALNRYNKQKEALEPVLDEERKKQNTIKSDIQFKVSRRKMLLDMENNLEGYNRSVKAVLLESDRSRDFGKGIHGALVQLIKVEEKYETAIEMALGAALQNIVTDTEEEAKKAIEFLKQNKLGRATFLPISSVRGKPLEEGIAREITMHKGYCGIASDLLKYNDRYGSIILSLLGRVVVVEDLESGIALARKYSYAFRIVTLEGEILSTSGSLTGGSTENRGTGILSRNREILELKNEIERLEKQEKRIEAEINDYVSQLNELNNSISLLENEIRDNQLARVRDESHMAQVQENMAKASARMEMLRNEKEQLKRQYEEVEKEHGKYLDEQKRLEDEINETRSKIARFQEKHKEGQSLRDTLHADITDYKISVNSILESMEGVKETIERINSEKEAAGKGIQKRENEKVRNLHEIKTLKEKNEGLKALIRKHEEEKTGKTFEMDRIAEERKVLEEELFELVNNINEINKKILLLKEDFNRLEVKKAKIDSEIEVMQNRMWDEYELTYNNAIELKKDIGSITQAQKRINECRNLIKELGPVNVGAIDDYIKTKERYEFMAAQRDDMEKAKEKLHRVIYEMTSTMKKQFMEQFRLINDNFNVVFKELFDGGRAELKLSDADNVLESGIEIEAQPPGKRLQNMMLLSGGERALTAIALLFAILRLRPTPFCVLDEIEAALDDANVYRFSQYLRRLSRHTQFIMVTHRKGTMEGSDMLYGVTMQEHGISKIVSMRIGEMVG